MDVLDFSPDLSRTAKRATAGHHYFENPPDQSEENNNSEHLHLFYRFFTNEDQQMKIIHFIFNITEQIRIAKLPWWSP